MKTVRTFVASLSLLLVAASVGQGAFLSDIEVIHGGSIWNNHASGNWAIWEAAGNTTGASSPPAFLNDSGAMPPLGVAIPIPFGTTTYTLYRADNGDQTVANDIFHFSAGASTGTITFNPNAASISTATAPTMSGGPLTIGNQTITITGFDWYAPSVFKQTFVGGGQSLTPDTKPNDVALLTITVTPEPSSLLLCGLGAIGLFVAARRRRKA